MARSRASLEWWLLALVVGLGVGVTIIVLRVESFGIVVQDGHVQRLMDFASHRGVACAAWSEDGERHDSIYGVEAHRRATERWAGVVPNVALPFAYAPTMLWVLGPLCPLPPRAAFAVWSLAGVLAVAFVARRAHLPWWVLLALLTPVTVYTLALGQTALLGTAGLLWLVTRDRDEADTGTVADAVVLWLLTAKPPLAIAAGTALLARRRWRVLGAALALTLASTLALGPWLGPGWWRDYTALLAGYDGAELPPVFAWSITPALMSNLRATLHVDAGLGDALASRASAMVWAAASVGIVGAAWRGQLDRSGVWAAALLALLLFCPHLSASEELALVGVLAALHAAALPRGAIAAAVVLTVGGLVLSPAIGPLAGTRPSLLFIAKLALATVLAGTLRGRRRPAS